VRITIYAAELSPAQDRCINDLNGIVVRPALIAPSVIATLTNFHNQEIKIVINEYGVVQRAWLQEES